MAPQEDETDLRGLEKREMEGTRNKEEEKQDGEGNVCGGHEFGTVAEKVVGKVGDDEVGGGGKGMMVRSSAAVKHVPRPSA